jgi:CRP-like cAMP-binding protein
MTNAQPDLLQGLTSDQAAALMSLGSRKTLAGGAVLFNLGDNAELLFLVERGRVNLTLPMQIGQRREEVLVEERGPEQMLGWSALIPPHRFTLNAVAPLETVLMALPRQALLDHFAAEPEVARLVLTNLATIIGRRLQVLQTMWLREMQRVVELRCG